MAYSEESLGQNEKLIYQAHFHPLYYVAAWVSLIFFLALATGAVIYADEIMKWVLLAVCAAGLTVLAVRMKPIWTTEIAVTNHRLVLKRGWLSRSTTELQLKNIEEVNFHQGLLGRIFGFGQIVLHGTGVDDLILPNIANPTDLVKAIENASIPVKQPPLAPSDTPSA
jgi:membrane protein YdbS with pleckstrin-like domain